MACRWLAARTAAGAVREILAAAGEVSASRRLLAVGLAESLGDDALPAWREMAGAAGVGPYARAVLAYGGNREVSQADWRWLAVDRAAAALADSGPDEALTRVCESLRGPDLESRLAAVRSSGHPDAGDLAGALAEFIASGATLSVDQVLQLKVTLTRWRPPIWPRVLVPAAATSATRTG